MNTLQIENTKNLLSGIEDMLGDASFKATMLNSWINICGSYRCVLGDYIFNHRKDLIANIIGLHPDDFEEVFLEICDDFDFLDEFGFKSFYFDMHTGYRSSVIGCAKQGSLVSRYHYVKQQLINAGEI